MTPGPAIRVMVVDDSAVVRLAMSRLLNEVGGFNVVGAFADGHAALAGLDLSRPDVVVLDVEMPGLDGIATLRELRKRRPKLPVVMFSAITKAGAAATIAALTAGASDYVTKPSADGPGARAHIERELVPKLRALTERPAPLPMVPTSAARAGRRLPVHAIVIGASTGGPSALHALLRGLPRPLTVPVVVVQHMPPAFTRSLAQRLADELGRPVVEASAERVRPGVVYIARGGVHLRVVRRGDAVELVLDDGPLVHSVKPAVDVLFKSAAEVWGGRALAVVLTGMGVDGLDGCRLLATAGATIMVQDQDSSTVWGMPGAVARNGLADLVGPPEALASAISHRLLATPRPQVEASHVPHE